VSRTFNFPLNYLPGLYRGNEGIWRGDHPGEIFQGDFYWKNFEGGVDFPGRGLRVTFGK